MNVRPSHSEPEGGSTRRAIARRASDTTLAKVASRTASSHRAVRAPARVARSRCIANQATSSSAFDRSNRAGRPSRSTTSTGPSSRTIRDQGSSSSAARGSSGSLVPAPVASSVRGAAAAASTAPRSARSVAANPTGDRRRPTGESSHPSGAAPQRPRGVGDRRPDDHRQPATASGRGPHRVGRDVAGGGRAHQDDGRLPRFAAGVAGPEDERRLAGGGGRGRADVRGGDLQRDGHRVGDDGVAMIEERPRVDRRADERGHLGEDRRREGRREAVHNGVGELVGGVDGQDAERLQVGEHLATVVGGAELGQRGARRTDAAGGVGEELEGRRSGQRPALLAALPWSWQPIGRRQQELDRPVVADLDERDARRAVDQGGGGGPDRDVDAEQPLAGVDRSQPTLGRDHGGRRVRHTRSGAATPAVERDGGTRRGPARRPRATPPRRPRSATTTRWCRPSGPAREEPPAGSPASGWPSTRWRSSMPQAGPRRSLGPPARRSPARAAARWWAPLVPAAACPRRVGPAARRRRSSRDPR